GAAADLCWWRNLPSGMSSLVSFVLPATADFQYLAFGFAAEQLEARTALGLGCGSAPRNNACLAFPQALLHASSLYLFLHPAVNFEALIIAMSVVGGMILIMLGVCCCCCSMGCSARERERRRVRQEERRAEMKSRHDEIRRKYGLFKEENPYAKFDN
uniref:PTTG1 interacting protein n=1 Tax=Anser cygnoides TaxID=8845 RepID=A0A8B9IHR1_ANSCY